MTDILDKFAPEEIAKMTDKEKLQLAEDVEKELDMNITHAHALIEESERVIKHVNKYLLLKEDWKKLYYERLVFPDAMIKVNEVKEDGTYMIQITNGMLFLSLDEHSDFSLKAGEEMKRLK